MTPTDNHSLITGQERREKRRQTEGLSAGWIMIAAIGFFGVLCVVLAVLQ